MNLLYPAFFKCVRTTRESGFKRVPIRKRVYPFVFMSRVFIAHKCESGLTWEIRDQHSGMVVVDGTRKCLKTKKEALHLFDEIMIGKTIEQIKSAFGFADEQIKTITEIIIEAK